jgi:hypothetical protein
MFMGQATEDRTMKITLISAASAIFICGTALASEEIVSPIATFHAASSVTEHRAAQLKGVADEGVVLCTNEVYYDDPQRREQ